MTNDYNDDRRPLEVVGVLVAIGAIGASRGQLVLRRLKWLASRTAALCLLVAPSRCCRRGPVPPSGSASRAWVPSGRARCGASPR
jgi:hypothetical protein